MLEEVRRHTLTAVMLKLQTEIQGIGREDGIFEAVEAFPFIGGISQSDNFSLPKCDACTHYLSIFTYPLAVYIVGSSLCH